MPGRSGVIGIPYGFLLLFFLLPFLIVLKISVSEMETVTSENLFTFKEGVLQLTPRWQLRHLSRRTRCTLQDLSHEPEVRRGHHAAVPVHRLPVRLLHGAARSTAQPALVMAVMPF